MNFDQIILELKKMSLGNEEYVCFHQRVINTKKQIWGVRLPDLRRLAKKVVDNLDASGVRNLLTQIDKKVFEQVVLLGLVIAGAKISEVEKIKFTKAYLKLVDSWAEIDVFCARTKRDKPELWWNLAVTSLSSKQEFVVRYGAIEMLSNFLDLEHLSLIFKHLRVIQHDGYYVKMAMAWLYATAAVYFYKTTLQELKNSKINLWTKRKAYQKMLESHRFNSSQKAEIRRLKQSLLVFKNS